VRTARSYAFAFSLIIVVPGRGWCTQRVLLLNSYHEGYSWTDELVRGVRAGLAASHLPIDLDIEYLDWRRHRDAKHTELFANFLRDKFAHTQLDVVIATDDPVVRLLIAERETLFPTTPVIFCGLNEYRGSSNYVTADASSRPWLAGILETVDLDPTVDLALRLHPGTREIVLVGSDKRYPRGIIQRHPGIAVRILPVEQMTFDEIGRQLAALKSGSVVIFSVFTQDAAHHVISLEDSARFVYAHTSVPIYSMNRGSLGLGVLGGKMTDGFEHGKAAAQMAIAVLKGVPPSVLGIQRQGPNPYEFDEKQLVRWHIPRSELPSGSVIINRPKSFYKVHPVWFWSAICFVLLQSGAILLLLVQSRRRRIAEQALQAHTTQLARSNSMLEQFAYVTAHDFQEPVRTVAVFTELLSRRSEGRLEPEAKQALNFALAGSQRMHSMLHGLLAWVRAVDVPESSTAVTESFEVVSAVVELHRDEIERKHAEISMGALPRVPVYREHLFTLMENLIANALGHSGGAVPRIAITADRLGKSWKFSVADNGSGIAKELQERAFRVFKRLNEQASGMGMGLAICRRLVDHYGGKIWVESAPGEGSRFCFIIPDAPRVTRVRRPVA
jgi:signal transduction histidine kinase/ABC-type uncharacterized transport system substrate-binding protein